MEKTLKLSLLLHQALIEPSPILCALIKVGQAELSKFVRMDFWATAPAAPSGAGPTCAKTGNPTIPIHAIEVIAASINRFVRMHALQSDAEAAYGWLRALNRYNA